SIPYTPQRRFIDEIKASIKASRKHANGGVKRTSEFPYNGGLGVPSSACATKSRRLLSSYCASPSLAHSFLLEFNYRWNFRMAVKNRGLRKEIRGFHDQFEILTSGSMYVTLIYIIYALLIFQRDTASWYPDSPMFSDWVSALDVADTGESSGLSEGFGGPDVVSDMPADPLGEQEVVQNDVPLARLTHSAKQYARMMDSGLPCTPVHNGVERRKFVSEVDSQLFKPGDQMGWFQRHQRINFDKWATEWNRHCDKIESGRVEWEAVYRKTGKQLQAY
ncbi:unnamed protein product, partial [Laminaria digitata]